MKVIIGAIAAAVIVWATVSTSVYFPRGITEQQLADIKAQQFGDLLQKCGFIDGRFPHDLSSLITKMEALEANGVRASNWINLAKSGRIVLQGDGKTWELRTIKSWYHVSAAENQLSVKRLKTP